MASPHMQVKNGGVLLPGGSNLVLLDVVVNGENIQPLAGDSKTSYCNQYRVISPSLSQWWVLVATNRGINGLNHYLHEEVMLDIAVYLHLLLWWYFSSSVVLWWMVMDLLPYLCGWLCTNTPDSDPRLVLVREETWKSLENLAQFLGRLLRNLEKSGPVFLSKLLENSRRKLVQLWESPLATLHTILWTWLCLVPPGYTSSHLDSRHLLLDPQF